MHKSPTELAQNAQRRMATALRLGATLDAGPRSTCALWKSNDGDMCEHSLATTRSAANTGEPGPDRTAQSSTLCAGSLSKQAVHGSVRNNSEAAPVMRCAILDVVSWFPGVLQQLWIDVSARCPHAERCNESASKPGWLQLLGKRRNEALWNGLASVGLRDLWKTGR